MCNTALGEFCMTHDNWEELLTQAPAEPVAGYEVPALAVQQNKAENLKTDLEKLLDELTFTA
jgi:hypothetical protein